MRPQQSHVEKTLALAKEQGVLRPRDLEKQGIPRRYAYALARAGQLRRVGRGLYVHPDNPPTENHSLALVGKRAPDAVVCLLSALRFHELTTQLPSETWVAVHPKARPPQIPGRRIPRKSLHHLLRSPCRSRVFRHSEVKDAAAFNREKEQNIKGTKSDCWHHQEIDRDDFVCVILEEGAPCWRR